MDNIIEEEKQTNNQNIIQGNEYVLLIDNRDNRKIVNLRDNRKLKWRKKNINIKQIIGQEYHKVFEFSSDKVTCDEKNFNEFYNYEEEFEDEQQIDKDNRNMFSDQSVQKLTPQQIEELKKDQSISKQELIKIIQQSNANFDERTAFSKEKYIKRKKEKYCFYFTVLRTTPLNVIETLFKENAKLVNYMRGDSFSLFMHYANLYEGANVALFDNTKGAILGASVLKLNGKGKIHYMKQKIPFHQIACYSQMNIPKELGESVEFRNPNQVVEKKEDKFTHLLIVGDYDVLEIIKKMDQLLIPNATVVVYSNYLECLVQPSEYMISEKNFVSVKIFDVFFRQHQVLKNRTHPFINMSGFSGYILSAYKVQ